MALSAGDVPAMYTVLVNSLSADEATRRPAEAALAQCEARPGFCSCLLEIISARGLSCREDVRLLATVYFKNSINRYWRTRRDSYGISNEEKDHLRKNLLLNIREENNQSLRHVLFPLIERDMLMFYYFEKYLPEFVELMFKERANQPWLNVLCESYERAVLVKGTIPGAAIPFSVEFKLDEEERDDLMQQGDPKEAPQEDSGGGQNATGGCRGYGRGRREGNNRKRTAGGTGGSGCGNFFSHIITTHIRCLRYLVWVSELTCKAIGGSSSVLLERPDR